jgi:3-keto-5-aminohexanoate cleavage enzyme
MKETGVVPELEVFEAGMVNNVKILCDEGVISKPLIYNFCLGFRGALPATSDNIHFLKSIIPTNAPWGFVHHGMRDLSLLATAIGMGASIVRVGFEDSVYLAPGKMAVKDADLVRNVVSLIHQMGLEIATPSEARELLGIPDLSK